MPCSKMEYEKLRQEMVAHQLVGRDITDELVLHAMQQIPRHCFVPEKVRDMAYEDRPLPIGQGQTISQPYMVALMCSLMQPDAEARVLEIGTGSGYQAAVLAHLFKEVFTIELLAELAENAKRIYAELEMSNIQVKIGDGSAGWSEHAPYHAIIVTAASPAPPQPLLNQLTDGGRLIIPVGNVHRQTLQIWTATRGKFQYINSIPVAFVPLRGKYGWSDADWQWYDL